MNRKKGIFLQNLGGEAAVRNLNEMLAILNDASGERTAALNDAVVAFTAGIRSAANHYSWEV